MADDAGQDCSPKLYDVLERDIDPGEISRDAPDETLDGMIHFFRILVYTLTLYQCMPWCFLCCQ